MSDLSAGIIVLNKPPGMTSQQTVTRVKRLLGVRKAGHSGILDPDVTGVLPILFGSATRLADYITDSVKEYEAVAVIGWSTDTQDASGVTLSKGDPTHLTDSQIEQELARFEGYIEQLPPQYSAHKVAGIRAYELARKGEYADLAPHHVHVYSLQTTNLERRQDGSIAVTFTIRCGKGTYVRTICHDLGARLGVPAHMEKLVRTHSGPFSLRDAHTLDSIEQSGWKLVLPPEQAVLHLPSIVISEDDARRVSHGSALAVALADDVVLGQEVRIHKKTGELLALYVVAQVNAERQAILSAKKVLAEQEGS